MKKVYSVKEAAKLIGVSTNTLYEYLDKGHIKGVRIGKGRFKIPESELAPYINSPKRVATLFKYFATAILCLATGGGIVYFLLKQSPKIVVVTPSPVITVAPTPSETSTPIPTASESVKTNRFALFNGTEILGATASMEARLKKLSLSAFSVTARAIAENNDYTKSIIVDLLGGREIEAAEIAKRLSISVSAMPIGEKSPDDADFLIIVGNTGH